MEGVSRVSMNVILKLTRYDLIPELLVIPMPTPDQLIQTAQNHLYLPFKPDTDRSQCVGVLVSVWEGWTYNIHVVPWDSIVPAVLYSGTLSLWLFVFLCFYC